MSVSDYFTDAVLRGPTIGSMLMCLAASLIGVVIFLRKQSLIGEVLSHASYPGVILGVIAAGFFSWSEQQEYFTLIAIVVGAYFTAILGVYFIHLLVNKLRIKSDAALCFVLSSFFGVGITLASQVQFSFTSLYRQAQEYLYGQAATMTDVDIYIYGFLAFVIIMAIMIFKKEIETITFDQEYAYTLGINVKAIQMAILLLTALAVIIGIRSVGVVLMSAMLIIPPTAAKQFTHRFTHMMILSAIFGVFSAFFGNVVSFEITSQLQQSYSKMRLSIPTGPSIVIVATVLCFFSLLFAPENGIIPRLFRIMRFRYQCVSENILKAFWRQNREIAISFDKIKRYQNISSMYLFFILNRLVANGWLKKTNRYAYLLTKDGEQKAQNIIRLHRLWEVYLVDYLGMGVEKVHRSAEEMEHILTPQLEQELTTLLNNPKVDPHKQKIPPKAEVI